MFPRTLKIAPLCFYLKIFDSKMEELLTNIEYVGRRDELVHIQELIAWVQRDNHCKKMRITEPCGDEVTDR